MSRLRPCLRHLVPLRIHRWYERLHQYNFTLQYTPGRENVVADLLSCSAQLPATDLNPATTDLDLIQFLHSPLEATMSLQELQQASEQDPVLSQLRTIIHSGWPPASCLPNSLMPFHHLMSFFARGHCTYPPYPPLYGYRFYPWLMEVTWASSRSSSAAGN